MDYLSRTRCNTNIMTRNDRILIVGMGVTGGNLYRELQALCPDVYDIDKRRLPSGWKLRHDKYDMIFICVDTPYVDEHTPCDLSSVRDAIGRWKPHLYYDVDDNAKSGFFVIKSTMLPGSTEMLEGEFETRIVYSPEYYGGTQHCNNFSFPFTIIGSRGAYGTRLQQLLQKVHDGRHSFRHVDTRTAEMAKYMENCWLATKVSFCCQFFDIAENNGVGYEELRELFVLDPRVNPSHTFVYRDAPFWDSHCLNKDVRAMALWARAPLLQGVVGYNEALKKKYAQPDEKDSFAGTEDNH